MRLSSFLRVSLIASLLAGGCLPNESSRHERLLSRAQAVYDTDIERALNWTTEAADAGHVPAMLALGNHHLDGQLHDYFRSVRTDTSNSAEGPYLSQEASSWFGRALTLSLARRDTTDLLVAAQLIRNEMAGPSSIEEADELAMEAISKGMSSAWHQLVHWTIADKRYQKAEQLIEEAKDAGITDGYLAESFMNGVRYSDDILAIVQPLAEAELLGDVRANTQLMRIAYNLKRALREGDESAAETIEDLRAAGFWREPRPEYFPGLVSYSR